MDESINFGQWLYQAKLNRVVDGDTMSLIVDLGFRVSAKKRVRLLGIDTAEIYGVSHSSETYHTGMTHSEFVKSWFSEAREEYDGDWPLIIETQQDSTGAYGRWLASVTRKCDYDDVASALIDEFGDSVVYE